MKDLLDVVVLLQQVHQLQGFRGVLFREVHGVQGDVFDFRRDRGDAALLERTLQLPEVQEERTG